jgi:hypothetical protein
METLRRAHRLTCLLLAWFALSVGVAIAAPVIQPQSVEMVCSGVGGMKMMVTDDDGAPAADAGHMKDCRQCVMMGAPPVPLVLASQPAPAQEPVAAYADPQVAAWSAAPLSARGPPLP